MWQQHLAVSHDKKSAPFLTNRRSYRCIRCTDPPLLPARQHTKSDVKHIGDAQSTPWTGGGGANTQALKLINSSKHEQLLQPFVSSKFSQTAKHSGKQTHCCIYHPDEVHRTTYTPFDTRVPQGHTQRPQHTKNAAPDNETTTPRVCSAPQVTQPLKVPTNHTQASLLYMYAEYLTALNPPRFCRYRACVSPAITLARATRLASAEAACG